MRQDALRVDPEAGRGCAEARVGRRVEKNAYGVVTRCVWDGNVPLHEWPSEADAAGDARASEGPVRSAGLAGDDAAWAEALRKQAEDEEFGWIAQELLDGLEAEPEEVPADEDGVVTWLFEAESFSPLARVSEKRGAMAVFTDHLGTPLCLTDAAGEVAWQGITDTFGRCEVVAGDAGLCPWRFPGQYADDETGLFYNRFRYYSAELGGYVSRDPIGLAGGLGVHGYVGDPTTWVDPLGLAGKKPGDCAESSVGDESPASRGYDRQEFETKSGKAVGEKNATERWDEFLGPTQTNIDPRDGLPDPDRIWSGDGKRSIRFGPHEMNSKPNKMHYHEETWHTDKVENVLQRVPGKKA